MADATAVTSFVGGLHCNLQEAGFQKQFFPERAELFGRWIVLLASQPDPSRCGPAVPFSLAAGLHRSHRWCCSPTPARCKR